MPGLISPSTRLTAATVSACDRLDRIMNCPPAPWRAACAKKCAERNPNIRVVNNERNLGFGGAFREGLLNARKSYSVMVCADNCISGDELYKIIRHTGERLISLPPLGLGAVVSR